jgi:hypothetical protein
MTMKTAALDTMHEQHHGLTVDAIARVILSSVLEPGDANAGKLVDAIGAAETVRAILDTDDERTTEQLRERARSRFSIGGIEQALRAAARFGATLITPEHPHWPTRVNDLGDLAPFALWVRGNSEILTDAKTTAIVGARAATGYGEHITMELAAGLVERGHTIASGAAYGIDGMAHRAALASHGRTIAYLAGGVDRFYPGRARRAPDTHRRVRRGGVRGPMRNPSDQVAVHPTQPDNRCQQRHRDRHGGRVALRLAEHREPRHRAWPTSRSSARTSHQRGIRGNPPPHPRARRNPHHQRRRGRGAVTNAGRPFRGRPIAPWFVPHQERNGTAAGGADEEPF